MTTVVSDIERLETTLDYACDDWSKLTDALIDRAIDAGERFKMVCRNIGCESDAAAAACERVAAWEAAAEAAEKAKKVLRDALSLVANVAKLVEEAESHDAS